MQGVLFCKKHIWASSYQLEKSITCEVVRARVDCKNKAYNSSSSSQEIVRQCERLITPFCALPRRRNVRKRQKQVGNVRSAWVVRVGIRMYACRPHSSALLFIYFLTLRQRCARHSQSWADEISALLKATCKEIEMEHGSRGRKGRSECLSLLHAQIKGDPVRKIRSRKVIFLAWKPSDGNEEMKISRNGNCCESSWNVYCGHPD